MAKEKTTELSPKPVNNTPSKIIERNEFGLVKGIDYVFNEDFGINWRKMIPKEFLVPNKQAFKGKEVPTNIEGLEDRELLSLLGGSKYLASLRGFTSVKYVVNSPSDNYVIATCEISWIPNYETEGKTVIFSAIGDAKPENTNSFAKNYLAPIAENRAFVRCVRNFLKIAVLSQEEIGGNNVDTSNDDTATSLLRKTMTENKVSFETIQKKMTEEKIDGSDKWTGIGDIPQFIQFSLIQRIKEKAAAKAT